MERIDKDETIDFQRLFAIIADRKKLFGKIIAGFTVLALIISLVWPKEYTSEVKVQASSGDMGIGGAAAAMAALAGTGTSSKATTYIELMKISAIIFLYSGLSIVKAHQLHTAAALYRILTCFPFKQPNNYQLNYN